MEFNLQPNMLLSYGWMEGADREMLLFYDVGGDFDDNFDGEGDVHWGEGEGLELMGVPFVRDQLRSPMGGDNRLILNSLLTQNLFATYRRGRGYGRQRYQTHSSRVVGSLFTTGVRIGEALFARRVWVEIRSLLPHALTEGEVALCVLWTTSLKNFQRTLGREVFLYDTVLITLLSIKQKTPHLLIDWVQYSLRKMNFWRYRSLFHFLNYFFHVFLWAEFENYSMRGLRFKLKGKISVSGNARTRSIAITVGQTSFTTANYRVIHLKRLVPSFTGVMGLQMWFFF